MFVLLMGYALGLLIDISVYRLSDPGRSIAIPQIRYGERQIAIIENIIDWGYRLADFL